MNNRTQGGIVVSSLLALGVLFLGGAGALVGQLPAGAITDFQLYAIAFAGGAWSMMVVVLALNVVSVRRWGKTAIGFDPRLRER